MAEEYAAPWSCMSSGKRAGPVFRVRLPAPETVNGTINLFSVSNAPQRGTLPGREGPCVRYFQRCTVCPVNVRAHVVVEKGREK
jgi:hypothetical protein